MTKRRVRAVKSHDESTSQRGHEKLHHQADLRRNTRVGLLGHLCIVIEETEESEGDRHEQDGPDVWVAEVSPEKGRQQEPDPDEEAAHCGGAALFKLGLKRQVPDRLALALTLSQLGNDPVAGEHGKEECGDDRAACTERRVVEKTEESVIRRQQLIQHRDPLQPRWSRCPSPARLRSCSTGATCLRACPSRRHSSL